MGVPQPATGSPFFPLPEFLEVESPQTKMDGLLVLSCARMWGTREARLKMSKESLIFILAVLFNWIYARPHPCPMTHSLPLVRPSRTSAFGGFLLPLPKRQKSPGERVKLCRAFG